MSKQRREKAKAKQRRHGDKDVPKATTTATTSNQHATTQKTQSGAKQAQSSAKQTQSSANQAQSSTKQTQSSANQAQSSTKQTQSSTKPVSQSSNSNTLVVNPGYIPNKQLEHAAPLWKDLYKALSESVR